MTDPTQRFSSRVTNYVKYRPSYPAAIIDLLTAECGLSTDSIVADVGSGTGLLAELFLKAGNRVLGIEPNREMREAGDQTAARIRSLHEHRRHGRSHHPARSQRRFRHGRDRLFTGSIASG